MAHGAHHSPLLPPHPDLGLARDCEHCLGWGTVVTLDDRHELCPTCQPESGGGEAAPDAPAPVAYLKARRRS